MARGQVGKAMRRNTCPRCNVAGSLVVVRDDEVEATGAWQTRSRVLVCRRCSVAIEEPNVAMRLRT